MTLALNKDLEDYFGDDDFSNQQGSGTQLSLGADPDLEDAAKIIARNKEPNKVEFHLLAVVKTSGGKNCVIEVTGGKTRAKFVEELMQIGFKSKYFQKRLRAVVGEPSGELTANLEEALKENQ
jgi:hypothetical protein